MRILFTFENHLPSPQADAEVFVTTARHLAALVDHASLHVPVTGDAGLRVTAELAGMPVIPAHAPAWPAALRHLCCGLGLVFRDAFRRADLVYTRNLWVAWMAVLFGKPVVYDHYRPWPDQIPPLQHWLYRLVCNSKFLVNICHSDYTRQKYLSLGIPADKLHCVRNGFEPSRLRHAMPIGIAKQELGIPQTTRTAIYTGRLNHKKGLDLVIDAATRLPDILFVLVGSHGDGPVEKLARGIANIRVVPWQTSETLARYIFAADILLIPPSWQPLARYGSTVLPLKLFLYMASGRPILAGDTDDVREVLRHRDNAYLCRPDCVDSLVAGLAVLTRDDALCRQLAARALEDSRNFTWSARADRILAIVDRRWRAGATEPGRWGRAQSRLWMRQSWRWVLHLLGERSWVLPPGPVTPMTPNAPAGE